MNPHVRSGILRTVIEERHTLRHPSDHRRRKSSHMDHSSEVVTCDGQGPAECSVNVWNILSHVPQEPVMHEFYQTMALEQTVVCSTRRLPPVACSARPLQRERFVVIFGWLHQNLARRSECPNTSGVRMMILTRWRRMTHFAWKLPTSEVRCG
jgi:hypothetical protein